VRGGLDDALDKLARRDELRRRAASEATGTSPAVTELVEAIAGVVARHPELGVTVGAEGSGDPVLLHFFFAEGQVQVTADTAVQPESAPPAARHADIVDVDLEDPMVEDPYQTSTISPPVSPPVSPAGAPRRMSYDDQDRYGPAHYGYAEPSAHDTYYADSDTAERRYGSPRGDDLWVAAAVVAMLLSLLGPIIAGLTISATVGLLAIHITAGAILIALLPQGIRLRGGVEPT